MIWLLKMNTLLVEVLYLLFFMLIDFDLFGMYPKKSMHSCYWKGHFVYFSGGDCVLPLPTLPFLTSQVVPVGGQPFQTVSRPLVFNQRLFDFMHCFTFTASVLLMARQGDESSPELMWKLCLRGEEYNACQGYKILQAKHRLTNAHTQTHTRTYTNHALSTACFSPI